MRRSNTLLRRRRLKQDDAPTRLSVSKTIQVIVGAVNDKPIITGRYILAAQEDTPMAVTGVSVDDPDCDDNPRGVLEMSITASNGTVQFIGTLANLYLMEAPFGALKIRGKTGPVNAALAGLEYIGAAEYSGQDTLVFSVDDLGNSGVGGALRSRFSVHTTIAAVNDPPLIATPMELNVVGGGVLFAWEDQLTPLGTFGISDPDDNFVRVEVSAKFGNVVAEEIDADVSQIIVDSTAEYAGNGTSVTLEGTLGEVGVSLAKLTYTSLLDWNSIAEGKRDVIKVSSHTLKLSLTRRNDTWA